MKDQCLPKDKVPIFYVCYFLFRIGVDRVTFPSRDFGFCHKADILASHGPFTRYSNPTHPSLV